MGGGFGDIFGFAGIAAGASISLNACLLAGRLLGYGAAVPGVIRSFFLGAYRASVLMGGIVNLRPGAIAMAIGLGYSFRFCGITGGAGICLGALFLAGSGLRYSAAVPSMVFGPYIAADSADLLMAGVICIAPAAVIVVAGDGNRSRAAG